jgi:hypothetical protein
VLSRKAHFDAVQSRLRKQREVRRRQSVRPLDRHGADYSTQSPVSLLSCRHGSARL